MIAVERNSSFGSHTSAETENRFTNSLSTLHEYADFLEDMSLY